MCCTFADKFSHREREEMPTTGVGPPFPHMLIPSLELKGNLSLVLWGLKANSPQWQLTVVNSAGNRISLPQFSLFSIFILPRGSLHLRGFTYHLHIETSKFLSSSQPSFDCAAPLDGHLTADSSWGWLLKLSLSSRALLIHLQDPECAVSRFKKVHLHPCSCVSQKFGNHLCWFPFPHLVHLFSYFGLLILPLKCYLEASHFSPSPLLPRWAKL